MVYGRPANRAGAVRVGKHVVDEDRLLGAKASDAAGKVVDGAIGLGAFDLARNDVVPEQAQERMALRGACSKPGVEQIRSVRQKIERGARGVQTLDQRRHLGKGMVAHLVEAPVERSDQLRLVRMQ